ncbi:uncharacterized protein [Temnothorax longispinosus]|uniref:uncharacterized protein n=1 Tax=Temnothorax longispinosus TaxID=300112 RepID=UPI003A99237B
MAEHGCGLGVIAEPYRVPQNHPLWAVSECGNSAITWRLTDEPVACSKIGAGNGFVVVRWDRAYVAGVYVSSAVDAASFERSLNDLKIILDRVLPAQVMVAGDFNAKSALWGSPVTDRRGRILECWAASLGLVVLNRGGVQTCVRHQGGSVIDLTWATPDLARRVSEWRVAEEIESLSDHLFIEMSLPVTPPEVQARRREANARFPRWALKKLDGDLLKASISTALWVNDPKGQSEDPDEVAGWIGDIMTQACDASMPRSKPFVRKTVLVDGGNCHT